MAIREDRNTVGSFVRALRLSRCLGLEQAAREAGVHRATLYRWEQGETQPRLVELQALLAALGADARQQRQALALMDAPRARKQIQREIVRIAEQVDLGPMPHGGELLRMMRLRRGFSLEIAAARLGVTPRTLRRWERGDVWPSAEQLHALCYTLGAYCAEVAALTIGPFSSVRMPDGEPSNTPADLEDRFLEFCVAPVFSAEEEALKDLAYLSFEAQAWQMAVRRDSVRELLTAISSLYAQYCSVWERLPEAGKKADRALEAGLAARQSPAALARAAIVGARAAVYRGERPAPRRGLERLQIWKDAVFPPVFQAWLWSDMAMYLALAGQGEAALELAAQAPSLTTDPLEQALRRLDQARVFQIVGRTGTALEALAEKPVQYPRIDIMFALQEVETLLTMGDASAAQERLQLVLANLWVPQWESLWVQAGTLTARLEKTMAGM